MLFLFQPVNVAKVKGNAHMPAVKKANYTVCNVDYTTVQDYYVTCVEPPSTFIYVIDRCFGLYCLN